MNSLKAGFLMVEILLSLTLITLFVVLCMRYQAQTLAVQAQAIDTMKIVEELEGILDDFKTKNARPNNSNCKFICSRAIHSVTIPFIYGNPPQCCLGSAQRMKVLTVTMTWQGQGGQHICCLPLVYKEEM